MNLENVLFVVFCIILFAPLLFLPYAIVLRVRSSLRTRQLRKRFAAGRQQLRGCTPIEEYRELLEQRCNSAVKGLKGRSYQELKEELEKGGRFVSYVWVLSLGLFTLRNHTAIYYIAPGARIPRAKTAASLFSFLFGWWGLPFGLLYTPAAIRRNAKGGLTRTTEVLEAIEKVFSDSQPPAVRMPRAPRLAATSY